MSGLWFVIRIVVESLAPAFTKFTKPTRLTPLYVPGTQASTLDVMPSACTFPSRAARTERSAFVQPAPCCRMSRCASSAPDFSSSLSCTFVGNVPWAILYACAMRALTPAVTGVACEVPLKMSNA